MRLSKFLYLVICVTFLSLFYVWQETEVFRLAYVGQKNQDAFQDLLDKNIALRYNIKQRTSLINIGDKVSKEADFQMPDNYRLVRLLYPPEIRVSEHLPRQENIVSRIFSIKRQAEAKTINP